MCGKKNIARGWEYIRKENITSEDYEVLRGQCEDKTMIGRCNGRQEEEKRKESLILIACVRRWYDKNLWSWLLVLGI